MEPITRFRDIPKFIDSGSWCCDFSFEYLVKWLTEHENMDDFPPLQMNPDFQRGHVWTEAQQIAYVEFLLRGGNSGRDVYLNCPSWHNNVEAGAYNDFVCVDGLQRCTAIKRFIQNEIPAFGTYFRDYADNIRSTNTLRIHINDLKSKAEVLQWYLEMNTGGTPHGESEILRIQQMLEREQQKP